MLVNPPNSFSMNHQAPRCPYVHRKVQVRFVDIISFSQSSLFPDQYMKGGMIGTFAISLFEAMFNTNPYAQAGWSNPQNSNSMNNNTGHWDPSNPPAPSVYGALPFSPPSQPASILTFRFVSLNPNILNCTILGPQSQPYFRVVTDMNNLHGDKAFTFVENSNGKITSVVHWSRLSIEVTDIVPKQRLREWLALSPDGS